MQMTEPLKSMSIPSVCGGGSIGSQESLFLETAYSAIEKQIKTDFSLKEPILQKLETLLQKNLRANPAVGYLLRLVYRFQCTGCMSRQSQGDVAASYFLAKLLHYLVEGERLHAAVSETSPQKNKQAVLFGDFLFSKAFEQMTRFPDVRLSAILSDAINLFSEARTELLVHGNNDNASWREVDLTQGILMLTAVSLCLLVFEKDALELQAGEAEKQCRDLACLIGRHWFLDDTAFGFGNDTTGRRCRDGLMEQIDQAWAQLKVSGSHLAFA